MKTLRFRAALMAWSMIFMAGSAQAIPELQLYIEGAVYDATSETWVADFSAGGTLRLWTIGNVGGPGSHGTIADVKLAIAYDVADTPTFALTSSTTGGYGGFTDPSTPGTPVFSQTKTDGSVPQLADGDPLPAHGEYGVGTAWSEYLLGNFSLTDSPTGDFINSFPTPIGSGFQINVYEIAVTGTDTVHFDLYNHVQAGRNARAIFAPFSHDAEDDVPHVPDGGASVILLGIGLIGLAALRRMSAAS